VMAEALPAVWAAQEDTGECRHDRGVLLYTSCASGHAVGWARRPGNVQFARQLANRPVVNNEQCKPRTGKAPPEGESSASAPQARRFCLLQGCNRPCQAR
jgi:hypothetical protein